MNEQDTILDEITRKKLIWCCHVERMGPRLLPKIVINWKPEERKNEAFPEKPGKMGYTYRAMSE